MDVIKATRLNKITKGVSVDGEGAQEPWRTPRSGEIKKNQTRTRERTASEIGRKLAAQSPGIQVFPRCFKKEG